MRSNAVRAIRGGCCAYRWLVGGRRRGCWTDEERKVQVVRINMWCGSKRGLASGYHASGPSNRDAPSLAITNLMLHFMTAAAKASDRRHLVLVFFAWKALLFLLPSFCPGPGYDTSALVLTDTSTNRHANIESSSRFDRFILNLFRWDALYFIRAAERGLVFEQEWAFSPAFSRLLSVTGQCEKT
jgi:hypothetical protein